MTFRDKSSHPLGIDADVVKAASSVVVVAYKVQPRVPGAPHPVFTFPKSAIVSGAVPAHPFNRAAIPGCQHNRITGP